MNQIFNIVLLTAPIHLFGLTDPKPITKRYTTPSLFTLAAAVGAYRMFAK